MRFKKESEPKDGLDALSSGTLRGGFCQTWHLQLGLGRRSAIE